nr:MAG TPA: protein of unknown function (DUF4393) [Bacteriophage sp.]
MIEEKTALQIVSNIINKFYDDAIHPPAQELGYVMGRIAYSLRLIGLIGLVGDGAIITENILKEKMENFLYTAFSKTPNEKRVLPDPTIICPLLENVANSFNKKDIVNLYSNLLSAATNEDTIDKVHPAFINIISQMDPLDAKIFYELSPSFSAVSCIILDNEPDSVYNIYLNDNLIKENFIPSAISIKNLERLGLISLPDGIGFFIEDANDALINKFKQSNYYKELTNKYDKKNISISSQPGYITNLGKQFKNICL